MLTNSSAVRQKFAEATAIIHRARVQADGVMDSLIDALQAQRRSMKNLDELNAKLAELQDAIEADEKADQEHADALQKIVDELQAKVDAGSIPPDFQAQIDKIDEIKSKLTAPSGTSTSEPGTPE